MIRRASKASAHGARIALHIGLALLLWNACICAASASMVVWGEFTAGGGDRSSSTYTLTDNLGGYDDLVIDTLAPSAPSPSDGATTLTHAAKTLSWTGGGGDIKYDVYFGTASPGALVSTHQAGLSYDTGTLAAGTTYYWKVVAFNAVEVSATSPVWSFTTGAYLTLTPTPSGAGTCDGGGWKDAGASVTLSASPSTGYAFQKWSHYANGSDTVTSPYTMPASDTTLYGIFVDNTLPAAFTPTANPASWTKAGSVAISFSTTDTPSGISHYEVALDSGSYATHTSPYNLDVSSVADGTHTVHVKAIDNAGNERIGNVSIYLDKANPTADVTLTPESKGAVNYLKGKITVDVTAADTGGSGVKSVEMKVDSGSYSTLTGSGGNYSDDTTTIDATWSNGAHSITVKVTDNADNSITVVKDFVVNKNEVSGAIGLHGFALASKTRQVTFVLNGDTDNPRTLTLSFVNGTAGYSFTDVDEITSISAKTAWSLRKKLSATPDAGQSDVDFTATSQLPGGDLNNDNVVNALDYSILRGAWGSNAAGDISGDGLTNNDDYVIMKTSWYKKGDAQ